MVKKMISFATAILMLCCMIPFGVFADDVLDVCPKCGERTFVTEKDMSASISDAMGMPFSVKGKRCTSCNYAYYDWNAFGYTGYKEFSDGGYGLLLDYLKEWKDSIFGKNASATQFQAGGGSASPGGVGRHPSGYVDDNGHSNYDLNGKLQITVPVTGWYQSPSVEVDKSYPIRVSKEGPYIHLIDIANTTNVQFYNRYNSRTQYPGVYAKFQAPISGTYQIVLDDYDIASIKYKGGDSWKTINFNARLYDSSYTAALSAGDIAYCYFCSSTSVYGISVNENFCKGYSFILTVEPVDTPVKKQTNITINNNTFNGNIYVDSTNKLTYIYPQYTTINENNETVNNISNNPIIYNQETKQYYTYDQTTNNYYYITYGDPVPTPTPSPSPDPGGSGGGSGTTPTPTPAPTPGGSDSSGGGSGFNPFKWLADLLKDIVEGIFKAVWKLITSIFGFLIWLVSLLGNVLPFLPSEGLAALSAAAIIITVIRIIKFILGR